MPDPKMQAFQQSFMTPRPKMPDPGPPLSYQQQEELAREQREAWAAKDAARLPAPPRPSVPPQGPMPLPPERVKQTEYGGLAGTIAQMGHDQAYDEAKLNQQMAMGYFPDFPGTQREGMVPTPPDAYSKAPESHLGDEERAAIAAAIAKLIGR